jgi:hypothetical protein
MDRQVAVAVLQTSAVHGTPSLGQSASEVHGRPLGQSIGQVTEVSPGSQTPLPHRTAHTPA